MAATIALKEQTKNRMNFETGYLFCHVETKSSNVCSGIFCFIDLFGMTSIVPLRRCRRAALHIHKMSAVQIHLSHLQKHFLRNFSRVIPSKSVCFCRRYTCTPLAICTGCAIMWIVTPAACAGGCKRRAPCKACPTIIIRKRSFT